jgi:hypothetical protein
MRSEGTATGAWAGRGFMTAPTALGLLAGASSSGRAGAAEPIAPRFAALVQGLVERQELPPMAPGARYLLSVGAQTLALDQAAIERIHATSRAMVQAFTVRDFRVQSVDCGRDLCWIRYGYRFAARTGTSETTGAAESEELWVRDGERLLFVVGAGRQ